MKSLKSMIREALENFDEFSNPYHIIIQINKSNSKILELLTEGKWVPSEEKGYWQRLDNPNFDFEQLHIHIANKNI